jgi:hypothetical protein
MSQNQSTSSRLLDSENIFGWVLMRITPVNILRDYTVTGVAVDHSVEVGPKDLMVRRIGPKGTHEDVDIGKDHGVILESPYADP